MIVDINLVKKVKEISTRKLEENTILENLKSRKHLRTNMQEVYAWCRGKRKNLEFVWITYVLITRFLFDVLSYNNGDFVTRSSAGNFHSTVAHLIVSGVFIRIHWADKVVSLLSRLNCNYETHPIFMNSCADSRHLNRGWCDDSALPKTETGGDSSFYGFEPFNSKIEWLRSSRP